MRPCLCEEEMVAANALCPVHMVWPAIRGRVAAGGPLFPTMAANSFNRHLKGTMAAMNFPQGDCIHPTRLDVVRPKKCGAQGQHFRPY